MALRRYLWKYDYTENMGSRVNVSSRMSCLTADFVISGVELYYSAASGFWPMEELGEQADGPTGHGEVARVGCLFAWYFNMTSLPVLRRRREVLNYTRRCLCISLENSIGRKPYRWLRNSAMANVESICVIAGFRCGVNDLIALLLCCTA